MRDGPSYDARQRGCGASPDFGRSHWLEVKAARSVISDRSLEIEYLF